MANEIKIGKAIKAINSSANYTFMEDDVDTIEWLDGTTPIAKEDILATQIELQAEYDAQQYARTRADKYPSWQDQLDKMYHDGFDAWKETIKAVKDAHPKP